MTRCFAILLVAACFLAIGPPVTARAQDSKGAGPAAPNPKFKGTAEDFVMKVLADPPGAAKAYSGQVIELEGTVAAPDKFTPKGGFVVTGATGKFTTKSTDLVCRPAKGVTVPTLGQRVKVVGTAGPNINTLSVDVRGCSVELVKAKP